MSYLAYILNLYQNSEISKLEMLELKTTYYSLDQNEKLDLDKKFNSVIKADTNNKINDVENKEHEWLKHFTKIIFEFETIEGQENKTFIEYIEKRGQPFDFILTDGFINLFLAYYTSSLDKGSDIRYERSDYLPNGKKYKTRQCYFCDKNLEAEEGCSCDNYKIQPSVKSNFDFNNCEDYLQSLDANSFYSLLENISDMVHYRSIYHFSFLPRKEKKYFPKDKSLVKIHFCSDSEVYLKTIETKVNYSKLDSKKINLVIKNPKGYIGPIELPEELHSHITIVPNKT